MQLIGYTSSEEYKVDSSGHAIIINRKTGEETAIPAGEWVKLPHFATGTRGGMQIMSKAKLADAQQYQG